MDKSARIRWTFLLTAAACTAVASFYPSNSQPVVAPPRRHAPRTETAPEPEHVYLVTTDTADAATDEDSDPFAPRGWQPPPPPEPVKPPPVAQAPIVAAQPIGPPPLPFKFMGRMDDGSGSGQEVVYLSRGDQTFLAQMGETLDGTYKVLAISADHIEFEHVPTGEKQTLNLPAPDK